MLCFLPLVAVSDDRPAGTRGDPGSPARAQMQSRSRADEVVLPAQSLDVAQTRLFARKHLDVGSVRYGMVDAGNEPTSQVKLVRWSVHHYILG